MNRGASFESVVGHVVDLLREVQELAERANAKATAPVSDKGEAARRYADTQPDEPVYVVFDGPPSHESGRFVEVVTEDGRSVSVGKWEERQDGTWRLGPLYPVAMPQPHADASLEELARQIHDAVLDGDPADLLAAFAERVRGEAIEECAKVADKRARAETERQHDAAHERKEGWRTSHMLAEERERCADDIADEIRAIIRAGSGREEGK